MGTTDETALRRESVRRLSRRLQALVVFREILRDGAVHALSAALRDYGRGRMDGAIRHLAEFEGAVFAQGGDWSSYLSSLIIESENVCIRRCGQAPLEPELLMALEGELSFLHTLSALRLEDLPEAAEYLTPWRVSHADIPSQYRKRMEQVGTLGYGIFARCHVFTLKEGRLIPVKHPDPQRLSDLPGYERERHPILSNTEALLEGKRAANVLLYGDAGTGKSSTVKAIANEYRDRGLRLVEVKKHQLYELPELMDTLAENPLKFILFIDDLSFTVNDDNFAALKAILEGSVGGRAGNVAVYATSNRRHLIKETLSDREGDDIHASDTRQELMSLAARFGLTVTFSVPDRDRFLDIVRSLASRCALGMEDRELSIRAEAFAIRSGGRSARVARQFVDLCRSGVLHSPEG